MGFSTARCQTVAYLGRQAVPNQVPRLFASPRAVAHAWRLLCFRQIAAMVLSPSCAENDQMVAIARPTTLGAHSALAVVSMFSKNLRAGACFASSDWRVASSSFGISRTRTSAASIQSRKNCTLRRLMRGRPAFST